MRSTGEAGDAAAEPTEASPNRNLQTRENAMNETETMKTLGFGTEIELEHLTREKDCQCIQSVVGGAIRHEGGGYDTWTVTAPDGRVWKAVTDGSLADRAASAAPGRRPPSGAASTSMSASGDGSPGRSPTSCKSSTSRRSSSSRQPAPRSAASRPTPSRPHHDGGQGIRVRGDRPQSGENTLMRICHRITPDESGMSREGFHNGESYS